MRAASWCKNADSKHFIWNSTSELRRDIGELKYRRCSLEDASLFIIIDLSVTSIFKNSPSRSDSYIWTPDLTLKISNYVRKYVECTRWIERLIEDCVEKITILYQTCTIQGRTLVYSTGYLLETCIEAFATAGPFRIQYCEAISRLLR